MRKSLIFVLLAAGLLLLPGTAVSDTIVDTGQTLDTTYDLGYTYNQKLAGQFTTVQDWYITSLEGYIKTTFRTGMIEVNVYPADELGGTPIITHSFQSGSYGTLAWQGASGFQDLLETGTYWIAFEVPNGSDFGGSMGYSSSPENYALYPEAYRISSDWVTPTTLYLGVRITGDPVVVPVPASLFLMGSGLLGLVGWRRFWRD